MTADFRERILKGKQFRGRQDFVGADFSKADLTGTDFRECNLRFARFDDGVLTSTRFIDCDLTDASFMHSCMGRRGSYEKLFLFFAFVSGLFGSGVSILWLCVSILSVVAERFQQQSLLPLFYLAWLLIAAAVFAKYGTRALWQLLGFTSLAATVGLPCAGAASCSCAVAVGTILCATVGIAVLGSRAVWGSLLSGVTVLALSISSRIWMKEVSSTPMAFSAAIAAVIVIILVLTCARRTMGGADGLRAFNSASHRMQVLGATSFRRSNLSNAVFTDCNPRASFNASSTANVSWPDPSSVQLTTERPPLAHNEYLSEKGVADPADIIGQVETRWKALRILFVSVVTFLIALLAKGSARIVAFIICLGGGLNLTYYLVRYRNILKPQKPLVILWIRKFHPKKSVPRFSRIFGERRLNRSSRRLQVLLEVAVIGRGHLITLGNDDVKTNSASRFERSWWWVVLSVLGAGALTISGQWPSHASIVETVISLITTFSGRFLSPRIWRRPRILSEWDYRHCAATAVRLAKTGKAPVSTILTCPHQEENEVWKLVISYLADKIDMIIVSGEAPADSEKGLAWEAELLQRYVPLERILYLGTTTQPSPPAALTGARVVMMPGQIGWWPFGNLGKKLNKTIGLVSHGYSPTEESR
ncbi:MAG: hypothetical protein DMF61_26240 [Blastocatellia bacterium AA13]|nr:MAG: hypothetical protein DMF61_26240 [Blastocatellia bacterium AA13]